MAFVKFLRSVWNLVRTSWKSLFTPDEDKVGPLIFLVMVAVFAAGIAAGSVYVVSRASQAVVASAYNRRASSALADIPSPSYLGGTRLIAFNDGRGVYTDQYIPDDLVPEDLSQVRAIVHFTPGQDSVGHYGASGTAYRRSVKLEIRDAVTGSLFPNATTTIYGGYPPDSIVTSIPFWQDRHGSYPDEESVKRWVEETWSALAR